MAQGHRGPTPRRRAGVAGTRFRATGELRPRRPGVERVTASFEARYPEGDRARVDFCVVTERALPGWLDDDFQLERPRPPR